MPSINSKSDDDLILHQALDARLLNALEFAAAAAELADLDVPADEYLLSKGYINEQQRVRLLGLLSDASNVQDETQCGNKPSQPRPGGSRPSPIPVQAVIAKEKPAQTVSLEAGESRYEWIEKFAQGGLGAVWRARDVTVQRKVALKELLPRARKDAQTVQRFLDEARITGQLQHPGVVPIYDIGTNDEGCPFYIMKFVEGRTLHEAIQDHHDQSKSRAESDASLRQLLNAFINVCRTMDYAHDQAFIHRDLKPRNIMLGGYGETLVVDWGLAMPVKDKPGETLDMKSRSVSRRGTGQQSRGQTRLIAGTPAYLAPEQARGEVYRMDARSDIYSLGVVLFEILTGKVPFSGSDSQTIIDSVLKGHFPPPRDVCRLVPSPLNSICLKAMSFAQVDRYQSARTLADEVERFLSGVPVEAHPETTIERAQRVLAKNQKTTLAVLCGLTLLSIVIGIAAWQINAARKSEKAARITAVAAREAETLALHRESIAKQEAVGNLRSALDAVDTWLLELSGDLEFYPGLSEKRTEFLESAANYYHGLSQPSSMDTAIQNEAARASIRAGDARQLLGRMDEALPMFDSAIAWFRSRLTVGPADSDSHKELANALIGKAIVLTNRPESADAANLAILEASEILHGLAVLDANSSEIRYGLARASFAAGRLAVSQMDGTTAISKFEETRRRLADIATDSNALPRQVALYHSTLFQLADLYSENAEFRRVAELTREARRSFGQQIKNSPTRPDFYEGRMSANILAGNNNEAMHRDDDALLNYEAATEDYHNLVGALFQGEYHSENLAAANINRARILLRRGENAAALPIIASAKDQLGSLIQLRGQHLPLLMQFANATSALGDVHAAEFDWPSASQAYEDAAAVYEHLRSNNASSPATDNDLSIVYRELAKIAQMSGATEKATDLTAKAIAMLQSSLTAENTNTQRTDNLHRTAASLHSLLGHINTQDAATSRLAVVTLLSEGTSESCQAATFLVNAIDRKSSDAEIATICDFAETVDSPDAWLAYAFTAYRSNAATKCRAALNKLAANDHAPRSLLNKALWAWALHQQGEKVRAADVFNRIDSNPLARFEVPEELWSEMNSLCRSQAQPPNATANPPESE